MTDTYFTPRHIRPRLKFAKRDCARCGGLHAEWWVSTAPPSCFERRIRAQGRAA